MGKKRSKTTKSNHDREPNGDFAKGNTVGFSGHPENINKNGRPPRPSLTHRFIKRLEEGEFDKDGERVKTGDQILDEIVDKVIDEMREGSFNHLKEFWARIDGKVPDRIAGHDGGPLDILTDEDRKIIDAIVKAADTETPPPKEKKVTKKRATKKKTKRKPRKKKTTKTTK